MFEYVHNVAGRVRLRAASLKANAELARKLQIALDQIAGVRSVEINLLTGSVLVLHDGRTATADAIARALCPFTRAAIGASIAKARPANLAGKTTRKAASSILVAVCEELLMTAGAVLL